MGGWESKMSSVCEQNGKVGICAMAKKTESRPMKQLIESLAKYSEIFVFPEAMILNEPTNTWPVVATLIAFHSTGYPLEKVREYVELRKPFVLNDLEKQAELQDRTKVYKILERAKVDVPRYAIVWRDGQHPEATLEEEDDQISIDDQIFKKPFVEKPVSAEDHNIIVYFPSEKGGGSRKLFRKEGDKSNDYSLETRIRRDASYVYEEFLQTGGTDVKVYAVGPDNAYAEARKAPSFGGKVERNAEGKESRHPVVLRSKEKWIARQIVRFTKQTVCGFDLLRTTVKGKPHSYVCDVNGFSLVKASKKYYDHTSQILRAMISRHLNPQQSIESSPTTPIVPHRVSTTTGTDMELRCVLAVIRHGDRTPKQKLKLKVDNKKWLDLYQKFVGSKKSEVKLKKPEQLQAALDTVRALLQENGSESTLEQMKTVLEMYGKFTGINRKIQLKRIGEEASTKFEIVVKWGGELAPAGQIQAEAIGKRFRGLYPDEKSGQIGSGFLRLHNTYQHDLKIYASDEGRVQTTAAAFARGLLAMDAELADMLVHMVKSADTDGLLDDDQEARQYQDKVKSRLKAFFQMDRIVGEQDRMQMNPLHSNAIQKTHKCIENPRQHCERLWILAVKLCVDIQKRCDNPLTKDEKLYDGETWALIGNRWRKLVKEFRHKRDEDGQICYEISKIHNMYDSIKYDLEHNVKYFKASDIDELHDKAKCLAELVIPQEYGIEKDEKLSIGQGTCTPLMKKLLRDLNACVESDTTEEESTNLDEEASEGIESPKRQPIESPERRVRTRLYFTSKGHLHSLMNVIRYGDLFKPDDEQWKKSEQFLSDVSEYNYLSQVVIMLFEDRTKEVDSESRFHVELHFSPGAMAYEGLEKLAPLLAKSDGKSERLISTGVIEKAVEEFVNPPLSTTAVIGCGSNVPELWASGTELKDYRDITCYVPAVRALATLSNRLTYRMLKDFLTRMTDKKATFPPM